MDEAQIVYQRSMRETMSLQQTTISSNMPMSSSSSSKNNNKMGVPIKQNDDNDDNIPDKLKNKQDVEVWFGQGEKTSLGGEVWMMDDGSIETKIPKSIMMTTTSNNNNNNNNQPTKKKDKKNSSKKKTDGGSENES